MTQEILWMCTFIVPIWMAGINVLNKNIMFMVILFAIYSALIVVLAKIYLGFRLFDGLFFDWMFLFAGCLLAFLVAKNIHR